MADAATPEITAHLRIKPWEGVARVRGARASMARAAKQPSKKGNICAGNKAFRRMQFQRHLLINNCQNDWLKMEHIPWKLFTLACSVANQHGFSANEPKSHKTTVTLIDNFPVPSYVNFLFPGKLPYEVGASFRTRFRPSEKQAAA